MKWETRQTNYQPYVDLLIYGVTDFANSYLDCGDTAICIPFSNLQITEFSN